MRPRLAGWIAVALVCCTLAAAQADLIDQLEPKLSRNFAENKIQLRLSGLIDVEGYGLDQPAPGLLYTDDNFLFAPRLSLFLDAHFTSQIYLFVLTRVDRGFDPTGNGAEIRLDEYEISVRPWKEIPLNIKAGKFGTVIGNWVPRHYSWENPFITAPLPYENLTGVWDSLPPNSALRLLEWGHVAGYDSGDYSDKLWRTPIIWGPSYTSGVAVAGSLSKFDYAVEMKNAAPASRPESWDLTKRGLTDPTFSGRVGLRPNEMWNLGLSGSVGPYLLRGAAAALPDGRGIGDYNEILIGQDVSFAWHHLQVWAEVFESRFEVPNVGNADAVSYYIEAKYKLTPQLFVALRWNQQLFGTIVQENEDEPWGNDASRVDAVVGYRLTEHLQLKLQYSATHETSALHENTQLAAGQLTVKF